MCDISDRQTICFVLIRINFHKPTVPTSIWPTFYPSIYFHFIKSNSNRKCCGAVLDCMCINLMVDASLLNDIHTANGENCLSIEHVHTHAYTHKATHIMHNQCSTKSHFKVQRYNKNDMNILHSTAWHGMAQWYTAFETNVSNVWHDLNDSKR